MGGGHHFAQAIGIREVLLKNVDMNDLVARKTIHSG
jgi:hypothetical protein